MKSRETTIPDDEHFIFLPCAYDGFDSFVHRTKKINGLVSTKDTCGRVYVSVFMADEGMTSVSAFGTSFEDALRTAAKKIVEAEERIADIQSLFACDGDHAVAPCLDPNCWLKDPEDGIPTEPQEPVVKLPTEGGAQ